VIAAKGVMAAEGVKSAEDSVGAMAAEDSVGNMAAKVMRSERSSRVPSFRAPSFRKSAKEPSYQDLLAAERDDEGEIIKINNYDVIKVLGRGAFSTVYLATRPMADNPKKTESFALKCMKKSALRKNRSFHSVDGRMLQENALVKAKKEIAILKKLDSARVVRMYEVLDNPDQDLQILVLEYVDGGQILDFNEETQRYACPKTGKGFPVEKLSMCVGDVSTVPSFLPFFFFLPSVPSVRPSVRSSFLP
jgi:serine/threonine protein kinase